MDHYVYVYIDPRNNEEFYYGKGKGSRKSAHLKSDADNEKARRISAIRKAGLEPVIRVMARGLSEEQALLVEKTLLHKLGKSLTNIASGSFADKFRPQDTLHLELPGFDFQTGVYYYNVGEGPHRQWDDYRRFGFISAGQGAQWARGIKAFNKGDIFAAYLKGKGYVGIGQITERARPIREVKIAAKPLITLQLKCRKMDDHIDDDQKCEYVALVDWIKSVPASEAKRHKDAYSTTHIRASLDNQQGTKKFLGQAFGVKFDELTR